MSAEEDLMVSGVFGGSLPFNTSPNSLNTPKTRQVDVLKRQKSTTAGHKKEDMPKVMTAEED